MRILRGLGFAVPICALSAALSGCVMPRYLPMPATYYVDPSYYGGGVIYPQTFVGGRPVYLSPPRGYTLSPGYAPPVYYAPGWGRGWQQGGVGWRRGWGGGRLWR
jgi:hypothetical protein